MKHHLKLVSDVSPDDSLGPSAWSDARIQGRLDSEMTALLRMHLFEVFSRSQCWDNLASGLSEKGFYLKRSGSNVWICDSISDVKICTPTYLGFPFVEHRLSAAA